MRLAVLTYHYFGDPTSNLVGVPSHDAAWVLRIEQFEQHIAHFKKHFQCVGLGQITGTQFHKPPILLTIDDGQESVYTQALPALAKYDFQAVLFVITSRVGTRGYCTWNQLRELSGRGVEIQSHAVSHRLLTKLNLSELSEELRMSKDSIEQGLGTPVKALAVPMGGYSRSIAQVAQSLDYDFVFTSYYGLNSIPVNQLKIRRILIKSPNDSLHSVQELLSAAPRMAFPAYARNLAKAIKNRL